EMNAAVIRALGIPMGLTHGEFIVTPDGVRLIEMAARGCGARVVTDLLPRIAETDILAARIRQAVGLGVHWHPSVPSRHGILEFFVLSPGLVRSIRGLSEAAALPGVIFIDLEVRPGDHLKAARSGDERHGFVLAEAGDRAQAIALTAAARQTIR